ncbi:hypothetical protein KIN20_022393 [Parelaphostrongylus tenuis]|uniref:Uncharacterized protein n=1 Tax=Parelaphostrongylus tenuis TaxID=148309 RepID=A0AAD5MQ47_PARTN|nr:hypothetical protein KIN20_022393 [Parelaphostrongylus tenuis]
MQVSYPYHYFYPSFSSPSISPSFFSENLTDEGSFYIHSTSLVQQSFFTRQQVYYQDCGWNTTCRSLSRRDFYRSCTTIMNNVRATPSHLTPQAIPKWCGSSPTIQQETDRRHSPYNRVIEKPLPVLPVDEVERILREIENAPRKANKRLRKKRETVGKNVPLPSSPPEFSTATITSPTQMTSPTVMSMAQQATNRPAQQSNHNSREELKDILKEYGLVVPN